MKIFKRFWVLFSLFAILICINNYLGNDDKGLLLHIFNPLSWNVDWYFLQFYIPKNILKNLAYILTIFFWFLFGLIIDTTIDYYRINKKENIEKKKSFIFQSLLIVLCLLIITSGTIFYKNFYNIKHSRNEFEKILVGYEKYPIDMLKHYLVAARRRGYLREYNDELITIANTTNDCEIFNFLVHHLSIIGDENNIKSILNNSKRLTYCEINPIALERNINTIIAMLDIKEEKETILIALDAVKILKFSKFIPSIEALISNCKDKEVVVKSQEALIEILKSPREYNKKWDDYQR